MSDQQHLTEGPADSEKTAPAGGGLLRTVLPRLLPGTDLTPRAARAASLIGQIQADIEKEWNGIPKIQRDESLAKGKALRKTLSRRQLGTWEVVPDRTEGAARILAQDAGRVPDLIPVRHARMRTSPFAFFRGAAAVMAADLGGGPGTGIQVQVCGDAHLANFGIFASPERRLVFDINDFDETIRAPWEWDVKRLCASAEICGRDLGFSRAQRAAAVRAAAISYRDAMQEFSAMGTLDVWYTHADLEKLYAAGKDKEITDESRRLMQRAMEKALTRNREGAVEKLTERIGDHIRIRSNPPLVVPFRDMAEPDEMGYSGDRASEFLTYALKKYRLSLPRERRYLIDQYSVADAARKVVGVGSVGTRCWIVVMEGNSKHDPLVLQIKEARHSVLEPYTEKSPYPEQSRRVIEGQRAIQTAGDILSGWLWFPDHTGRPMDYYVRQLWDSKASFDLAKATPEEFSGYCALCGWTLAHAHAKTGNRHKIAGYLGKGEAFPEAMQRFAASYADQNEADYAAFCRATAGKKTS